MLDIIADYPITTVRRQSSRRLLHAESSNW